jgi:hypothetical protein
VPFIIQGIIPSRRNQIYGGLNNFPRFLENWDDDLYISGSLLQLNFSNYATGAFDQDSWEPGLTSETDSAINHYQPPDRNFGYDVALQYSPAGPISQRFSTRSNLRSEFYRELAIDDPYIENLRCAQIDRNKDGTISTADHPTTDLNGDGTIDAVDNQADPNLTCS